MIPEAFAFSGARVSDYMELAKIRLVSLSLLSAAVGYFLAAPGGPLAPGPLVVTLAGTALVAAGSMAFNQWMERAEDARMQRTAARPLPAGRLMPLEALLFAFATSLLGLAVLYLAVNTATAVLAAMTLVSYALLYTPLKKKTSLCTIVGAIPGALPPMIGWAAVTGGATYEAWVLFAVIFLWQMPHFLAIAWLCRRDYEAAGFRMLSVEDPRGGSVARQTVLYAFALIPVSLMPTLAGLTGIIYFFSALVLGMAFAGISLLGLKDLDRHARSIFRASILYLALILLLMVFDKA